VVSQPLRLLSIGGCPSANLASIHDDQNVGIGLTSLDGTIIDTPVGPLTVLAGSNGAVRAAGFTPEAESLLALIHPTLRGPVRFRPDLGPISAAARAYLAGDHRAIDAVPVEQRSGGAFMTHSWEALRQVGPGSPVTYAGFAELAGRPRAIRAAAAACARNAAALFVPCHRVLRTGGALGGYRWGLPVKKWLLDHERRVDC
jgi:methylated-DNA-[protein]-cysteine S-methyltransferase